ncbi:MAG: hypothetical protein NT062_06715 [Proteobacteria bacterium]|nr:hypothetical protein [Pseudomonadota bacterium]
MTTQVVSVNVRLSELLAYDTHALIGTLLENLVYEPGRDITIPGHYEDVALRRSDDYPVFVELDCAHVVGDRELTAYVARDTSERRLLEREVVAKHSALYTAYADLERAYAQLEETKRLLEHRNREVAMLALRAGVGELVAGIAHHLNNPVGALSSTVRRMAVEIGFLPENHQVVMTRLLDRVRQISRRIESNVNAIVKASQSTVKSGGDQHELPHEVSNALASFVDRLDDISTKEPS